MTKLFLFVLIALLTFPLFGQNQNTPQILIGKREHTYFSREIKEENLGLLKTAYYRIFFKLEGEEKYRQTGIFGKKIKPYLETNPQSLALFKKYRTKKMISYGCLAGSLVSLTGWFYNSVNYIGNNSNPTLKGLFTSPGSLIGLAAYVGFGFTGTFLNVQGDKDLFNAVQIYNGRVPGELSNQKPSLSIHLQCIAVGHNVSPNVGLRLGF